MYHMCHVWTVWRGGLSKYGMSSTQSASKSNLQKQVVWGWEPDKSQHWTSSTLRSQLSSWTWLDHSWWRRLAEHPPNLNVTVSLEVNDNRCPLTLSWRKLARMLDVSQSQRTSISGLITFSQVIFMLNTCVLVSNSSHSRESRHGAYQQHIYILKLSMKTYILLPVLKYLISILIILRWFLSILAHILE